MKNNIKYLISMLVNYIFGFSSRFYGRKGSSFLVIVGMGFSFFFFFVAYAKSINWRKAKSNFIEYMYSNHKV